MMLVAPVIGVSIHSSVAKQSQIKEEKTNLGFSKSDSKSSVAAIVEDQNLKLNKVITSQVKIEPVTPSNTPALQKNRVGREDHINEIDSGVVGEDQHDTKKIVVENNLVIVGEKKATKIPVKQETAELIQKLRAAKKQALANRGNNLVASSANIRKIQPAEIKEVPVEEPREQADTVPDDPMGSPHPIPWKWIVTTQEVIGGKGGSGIRHYRSIPIVSPDGRYAVYSRVELEVRPEMHNSRVSSLLFLEDRQTKRLRVMSKTAEVRDPLLASGMSTETDQEGKIGVLVPVSWSKTGDRFLARKFVSIFNTADVNDHAVVWDRKNNQTRTVAPTQTGDDHDHEKISILLGWSKQQPDNVLFRSGELGADDWPLVQVASDGTGVNITTEDDQAVTFGERNNTIWSEPQVASR